MPTNSIENVDNYFKRLDSTRRFRKKLVWFLWITSLYADLLSISKEKFTDLCMCRHNKSMKISRTIKS